MCRLQTTNLKRLVAAVKKQHTLSHTREHVNGVGLAFGGGVDKRLRVGDFNRNLRGGEHAHRMFRTTAHIECCGVVDFRSQAFVFGGIEEFGENLLRGETNSSRVAGRNLFLKPSKSVRLGGNKRTGFELLDFFFELGCQ